MARYPWSIGIEKGVHVLDPVFFKAKNCWQHGKPQSRRRVHTPMTLTTQRNKDPDSKDKQEQGIPIYSVNNYRNKYCDKDFQNVANDFLRLIRDAEIVISNSFTPALSIILNKEFM